MAPLSTKYYLQSGFWLALIFSFFGSQAQPYSDGKGILYLNAGMLEGNVNTSAYFNITNQVLQSYPGINTSLDLEDDVNFPKTSTLLYLRGMVGGRLQGVFPFFSLHRSGSAELSKSFAFGDNTYTVHAPVSGYLNTDYYSATLRISLLRNELLTAGFSLGARYLAMGAGVHADSGGVVFDQSDKFNIPFAVPGIHASVYPIKSLLIRGSIEYLSLKISTAKGRVLESQLTAEFYPLKYLGVGAGYSITDIHAEGLPSNPIFLRDIDYKVGGLLVFAALRI